jgi:hypothetical protein
MATRTLHRTPYFHGIASTILSRENERRKPVEFVYSSKYCVEYVCAIIQPIRKLTRPVSRNICPSGVRIPWGHALVFSPNPSCSTLILSRLPVEWLPGSFQGEKWTERETDHSRPFSTKNKNECSCLSNPVTSFVAWVGTSLPFVYPS